VHNAAALDHRCRPCAEGSDGAVWHTAGKRENQQQGSIGLGNGLQHGKTSFNGMALILPSRFEHPLKKTDAI
jgi:hypothetical protein